MTDFQILLRLHRIMRGRDGLRVGIGTAYSIFEREYGVTAVNAYLGATQAHRKALDFWSAKWKAEEKRIMARKFMDGRDALAWWAGRHA